MKKTIYLRALCALLLLFVLGLSLVGCVGRVDDHGSCTVVIACGDDVREYSVPLDKVDGSKGAVGLLDYLKENEGVEYTSNDTGYGAYITSVGHLSEKPSENIYVGIWTSVESDQDRESEYSTTVTYEGVTLISSGVGLTQLSAPDGAVIYFGELRY